MRLSGFAKKVAAMSLALSELNAMSRDLFIARFGAIFEHSPWVAAAAWEKRPFRDKDHLLAAMQQSVREAGADEQLALIRAHPDLVGRAARNGTLAPASASEQASAGLDRLDAEEAAWFQRQNAAYQERFGFPFILCVRANRKSAIREGFIARMQNPAEIERQTALAEIDKIAAFRLGDLMDG